MKRDDQPPSVRSGSRSPAKQGGEARSVSDWAEPSVWTHRMLEALQRGVKGGKWFSLKDKVIDRRTLEQSFAAVRARKGAPGADGVTIEQFERALGHNLANLEDELASGRYTPGAVRRLHIPKPGTKKTRPLGIPTVRDRIVQGAVKAVIEPIFDLQFLPTSFGFRPRLGCKDALRRVVELLGAGHNWVVDADIEAYFDTVDHDLLMKEIEKSVSDGFVLRLLRSFLEQKVVEKCREWNPVKGTPQGAVISPLLANIHLHPVDLALTAAGFEIVRYADDLVVMCRSQAEAEAALKLLREQMELRKLKLHPEKTKIADANQYGGGFDFLGYHFEQGRRWPREKSCKALRARVRALTPRLSGDSIETVVKRLNTILCGWFEYFQHSAPRALKATDGWVRRRLRTILARRKHRRSHGLGSANRDWPINYFRGLGLFIMIDARAEKLRSLRG